ncbi:MAG: UxaA family hydrolase [bacterium]
MKKPAIVISVSDNVGVAKRKISRGTIIGHGRDRIVILNTIAQGQRFALTDIKKGEKVRQYGAPFGISGGIKKGSLVSRDNVCDIKTDLENIIGNVFKRSKRSRFAGRKCPGNKNDMSFLGYERADGRVGTRNFYLIVPASLCAVDVAVKIASVLDNNRLLRRQYSSIDGFVAAAHTEGCGCNDGDIIKRLLLTLKNVVNHPNVGGALVVDLGCEKTNKSVISKYFGDLRRFGKPVDFITIQDLGGTGKAVKAGKKIVLSRLDRVNSIKRKKFSIKHLVIGTECGASDSFSGITANPVIGGVMDRVIGAGGSGIFSETPEMIGAEAILVERMISKEVAKKFMRGMDYYRGLAEKLNVSMSGNLVEANRKSGLINVALKSLGAVFKGGSTEIVDFLDYAEKIKKQGLNIMNGPGNDLESMTGIAASGANLILFSTGLGATEGNAIVPVIRITSRTEIFRKLRDDMDFDAGRLISSDVSLDKLSNKLLEMAISVASGKKTHSEIWRKRSFQIWSAGKLSL